MCQPNTNTSNTNTPMRLTTAAGTTANNTYSTEIKYVHKQMRLTITIAAGTTTNTCTTEGCAYSNASDYSYCWYYHY